MTTTEGNDEENARPASPSDDPILPVPPDRTQPETRRPFPITGQKPRDTRPHNKR